MKAIFLFLFLFCMTLAQTQNKTTESDSYTHAAGVKIFDGGGISYKQFLTAQNAAEIIGYFYTKGFRLTGLYEVHNDINGVSGLKWYYGVGAHIGFYNASFNHSRSTVIGIDGV